ncbi:MAG: HU family DNA-binding protein [Prevotellaceae bacterium]|nr:HU family DNA-binding protein [Prevotellaceae bacterium]
MNKAELIDAVAQKAAITKSSAKKAVDAVLDVVSESLTKEEKVMIVGFGTFQVSKRDARIGRNPMSGATIKIPPKNTVKFSAGATLKSKVN